MPKPGKTGPTMEVGVMGGTSSVPLEDEAEIPHLEHDILALDDANRIDKLIAEMAKEADCIEKSRAKSNSPQSASRRVNALKSIGMLIAQKHELLKSEGLDPNAPAVRILIKLILEKVKQVMVSMNVDEETIQTFFTQLPAAMGGWEVELDRRIKQSLFQPGDTVESESHASETPR